MVKINDGERDALEDIFTSFSSDRVKILDKIILLFKNIFFK